MLGLSLCRIHGFHPIYRLFVLHSMLKYIAEDEQEYPELVIYVGLCKESKSICLPVTQETHFYLPSSNHTQWIDTRSTNGSTNHTTSPKNKHIGLLHFSIALVHITQICQFEGFIDTYCVCWQLDYLFTYRGC
jgi:hypothetical protein